ncbi:pentapeptide repeat-containing protein [Rathayibacter sp. YIM 133350]|uniref:pentapeptide repeat-containing protein n=1 Tax=Rathayibacter sp. YIM 133350 TaxID=3131992 RepID=UPI00307EAD8E
MGEAALDELSSELRADCSRCFALCCIALRFAASADFAIDKEAGTPCPHLAEDDSCSIHTGLRGRGFRGCTVYDCLGAGQKVSQQTFGGISWRRPEVSGTEMFAVFDVMRQLHELLLHLSQALMLQAAVEVHERLSWALAETQRVSDGSPEDLLAFDLKEHWAGVDELLRAASAATRAEALAGRRPHPRAGRGADLVGARLRGADLVGADLRGAYLIAADLRGSDAAFADLIGADLRDTDLRGADLSRALFLSPPQVAAAIGDATTRLPAGIPRPASWG